MRIDAPAHNDTPAPQLGEHTEAVLTEMLKMSKEAIKELKDREIIA